MTVTPGEGLPQGQEVSPGIIGTIFKKSLLFRVQKQKILHNETYCGINHIQTFQLYSILCNFIIIHHHSLKMAQIELKRLNMIDTTIQYSCYSDTGRRRGAGGSCRSAMTCDL